MSPTAALLAVLLHALTALALWLVSPLSQRDIEVEPVTVTFEEPASKAPETPAPTPQAAPPQVTPPPAPASPRSSATPAPSAPPASSLATPPPPPAQAAPAKPLGLTPFPPVQKQEPTQQAKPQEPPPVEKPVEKPAEKPVEKPAEKPVEKQEANRPQEPLPQPTLPAVETPPPPITSQDFPKPPPKPAAPPKPQAPAQQAHTAPPPPSQQQRLAPSPLSQHQNPTQQATAPTTTFINPAETYVHTKARDDYLWMVIGKFSQYLPKLYQTNQGGTVVLSFSIARDGRLIDASITKSSGVVALDRGLIEAIRAASPYPPVPAEIPGDRVTYTQPITARQ